MLTVLFAIFVVVAFATWFAATWPVGHAERVARGCFLVAACIWAFGVLHGH